MELYFETGKKEIPLNWGTGDLKTASSGRAGDIDKLHEAALDELMDIHANDRTDARTPQGSPTELWPAVQVCMTEVDDGGDDNLIDRCTDTTDAADSASGPSLAQRCLLCVQTADTLQKPRGRLVKMRRRRETRGGASDGRQ